MNMKTVPTAVPTEGSPKRPGSDVRFAGKWPRGPRYSLVANRAGPAAARSLCWEGPPSLCLPEWGAASSRWPRMSLWRVLPCGQGVSGTGEVNVGGVEGKE